MEFLQLCFAPVTLPFTMLLGAVFLYWIMCIVGFVGLDLFEVDVDLDTDVDVDVDVDLDVDVDVDVDADVDVDLGVDGGGYGSPWLSFLRFLNLGEVPTMIVGSVLIFCLWALSLLFNSHWNPEQKLGMALLLVVPNLLISPIVTRLLTAPFRQVFKRAKEGIAGRTRIVGKTVVVTTGQVTQSFGQAELVPDDEDMATPITLNVRSRDGQPMGKGQEALVVEHDAESNTYFVVPFDLGVK